MKKEEREREKGEGMWSNQVGFKQVMVAFICLKSWIGF